VDRDCVEVEVEVVYRVKHSRGSGVNWCVVGRSDCSYFDSAST
jgi:hypothetical protein